MQPTRLAVSERVRALREQAGWSQAALAAELAERTGLRLDPTAITRVENGTRSVRVEEAVAFAEVFGVPLGDLVGAPGADDRALVEVRHAQLELSRMETALTRALTERNDAQRRLNEIVKSHGQDFSSDAGLLELTPFQEEEQEKA